MSNPLTFIERLDEVSLRYPDRKVCIITGTQENMRSVKGSGYEIGARFMTEADRTYVGCNQDGQFQDMIIATIPKKRYDEFEDDNRRRAKAKHTLAEEHFDAIAEELEVPVEKNFEKLEARS